MKVEMTYALWTPRRSTHTKRTPCWAETCSIQSELHSCIIICSSTNQSEGLHNSRREQCYLDQSEVFQIPHLHKSGPIENLGRDFYKRQLPLCLLGAHNFPPDASFPGFANCLPEVFPFLPFRLGTPICIGLVAASFC